MKLGERFQAENSNLCYVDPNYEITEDTEDVQPNSQDDQRRSVTSTNEDDEVVKYMSNLPTYLKRDEGVNEKAFSVGVLDWRRLQKWQHCHKHTVQRTIRYSTSSTSTSSSHSTEASSSHASRGRSCSPIDQNMHRPTLRPCALASPGDIDGKTIKSSGEHTSAVEESENLLHNHLPQAHMIRSSYQTPKFWLGNKTEESKKAKMSRKIETSRSTHVKGDPIRSHLREKTEVHLQDCKYEKTAEQLKPCNPDVSGGKLDERLSRVFLLLPRNVPSSGKFVESQLPDSTASSEQKSSAWLYQASSSRKCSEVHHLKFESKFSEIKQTIPVDAAPTKLSSDVSHPLSLPVRASVTPCRSRNVEMRSSNAALMNDSAIKSSKRLDPKASRASSEKVRSSSPFRRLSISVGKIVKSPGSKEVPTSSELSSAHTSEKTCTENLESPANTTARSRSSPLRRMLDPLLKPKVSNCNHSDGPSKKHSESCNRGSRSSKGQLGSLTAQPAKKLDLTNCRSININNSHVEKKNGSSMVQAFLRVAIKNGLPLLTFAVDNNSDVLAATMKECSSSSVKHNPSWIYTFLTIREVKKKNGSWISPGGKGKGQDYVPNVVAQMKVSDSLSSNLREFILFSVESRKHDQPSSDFQPNHELAAIVSQIPLKLCPCSVRDGHLGAFSDGLDRKDRVNMTVILPGGVHSLPSKGGPSSLIQRWRSGGSCDCGGWDLGCQLKVLSGDHHNLGEKPTSDASSAKDHFALFPQVDAQENLPDFTLAPFKEGIYSIEFSSSLSVLQAFSICIAVLESRKMIEKSEDHDLLADKPSVETLDLPSVGVPTKYVSHPPLSPVGRV